MKNSKIIRFAAALAFVSVCSVHGQGSLTPPEGAPAPCMKTLDQIEPRTPLVVGAPGVSSSSSAAFVITKPGSYYLVGNLMVTNSSSHGIDVGSHDVTLDLNGFSIVKTNGPTSGYGVKMDGGPGHSVVIRNGQIYGNNTNQGFAHAIYANGLAGNFLVENITITDMAGGIFLDPNGDSTVINCSVRRVGKQAIIASVVRNCRVYDCIGDGIVGTVVSDCYVHLNTSGDGDAIDAGFNGTVMNCTAVAGAGNGIRGAAISNCYGTSTGGVGIVAYGTVSFSRAGRPSGTAIAAPIAIGCTVVNGTVNSAQKHLGTP